MAQIGFSTGCFYKEKLEYSEAIYLIKKTGATAIELSFASMEEMNDFKLSENIIKSLSGFSYITAHAPWIEMDYDFNSNTMYLIEKMKSLLKELPIKGIVIHPNCIKNYKFLENLNLPFLLENMNKGSDASVLPEHFENFAKELNFNFVFDIQHAFEHDQSMGMARRLISIMGNKMQHIHISGQTGSLRHIPLFDSENSSKIIQTLKLCPDIPIICEGIIFGDLEKNAIKELEFIKNNYTSYE